MPSTVFVLSGGASLGAVQVGMLQALVERDVIPDALVGTSVGSLNAGFLAGRPINLGAVEALAEVWEGLTSRQVFTVSALGATRALLGATNALCSADGLTKLVDAHLEFENLEEATTPLTVVTTDFLTGEEVLLDSGDARTAILASCAIPAIFPPVEHLGRTLVDGALANNSALSVAVEAGAEVIYVLPAGYACDLHEVPSSPWGAVVHAMTILIHQRLLGDLERFSDRTDVVVLPPPCPISVSPVSFGAAASLITAARAAAGRALDRPRKPMLEQAANIGFHTHG